MVNNNFMLTLAAIGVLFVCTTAAGIYLHSLGRPLNTPVFTIHKLTALGAIALLGLVVYRCFGGGAAPDLAMKFALWSGVGLVPLFASGALLSLDIFPQKIVVLVHNAGAIAFGVASAAIAYFLHRVQ